MSITKFRQRVFEAVSKALAGEPVAIVHKGQRVRIVPEAPADRLSRLTPMQVINPASGDEAETRLKNDMQREWENDWRTL